MTKSSNRWLIALVAVVVFIFVGTVGAVVYGVSRLGTAIGGRTSGRSSVSLSKLNAKAAIVRIEGVIEAEMATEILAQLDEIRRSDDLKAVLVRVDSPGGTVGASQEILASLKMLREGGKTVYCSFGDLAASGGFYVAMGCERIYSNPGTLTGSIGVIMQFMNLKDLYAWAKVQPEVLKAGRFKDVGSETRPMRDDERALLQKLLDDTHAQFRAAVLEGRPGADPAKVEEFADGRILSGNQALEYGLVDALGSQDAAKRELLTAAKLDPATELEELGAPSNPFDELFGRNRRRRRASITNAASELEGLGQEVRKLLKPGVHVRPGVPYYLPAFMAE